MDFSKMKEQIYQLFPVFFQNMMITLYNLIAYKNRYGGKYRKYRKVFRDNRSLGLDKLIDLQQEKKRNFVNYVGGSSSFYKRSWSIQNDLASQQLPIVKKEDIRRNIKSVYTIEKSDGIVSKTGGTTGKSLEVIFTKEDMQERFAMLDNFRAQFGYELGKKTAWFSGKNLLTAKDIKKNRFWKTDYWYKIRYYSTFHIKDDYLKYYLEDLIKYAPEYMVGFPSSILEIAKYGIKNNYKFPSGVLKAIFPTAETITQEMRDNIEGFFGTPMYNQYASSEGAPFIFECKNRNLHIEMQSGIFEVLDENDQPSNKGRLVVTSFTTHGTPLVRYDIGDEIELKGGVCGCGNNNPMVKEILGRIDDYVYSPKNGKINLGNVSNTLKDTKGIVKFQVIQDSLDVLNINVVVDKNLFDKDIEQKFLKNWRDRVGECMDIVVQYVEDIPTEASGKFRMVKNNIKHLI